ncbi:MAG TPA: protein kinase, partial [Candidatus Melainabacteria bacterium]|nr:protein kinase [Candidatus Melainabacteria bacterium]
MSIDPNSTQSDYENNAPSVGSPFEIGQVLGGKYEIVSLLGKGGMGAVYRVRHKLLNVELALKTLDSQRLSDASSSRRFQTEAKAAFSLKHPNLVKVHDFGVLENGHPFLVMDLVQG